MQSATRLQRLRLLAAATLTTVLISVALHDTPRAGWAAVLACNDSAPQCGGACLPGQICIGLSRGNVTECTCRVLGCCQYGNGTCSDDTTALTCFGAGNDFVANGTCGVDCLPQTPTATPSSTPTQTPASNGGSCDDPTDCVSGNCVADVCCDTACTGADQSCNQPGREGTCTGIAPAPAASQEGLLAILTLLTAIAAVALWRRRTG